MTVALVYDPAAGEYRFPAGHPMRPERFTLAVSLMRHWGSWSPRLKHRGSPGVCLALRSGHQLQPPRATHFSSTRLSTSQPSRRPIRTPPVPMRPTGSARVTRRRFVESWPPRCSPSEAPRLALDATLDGRAVRTFNPAGGLHHAARDRASGFCTLNDCAIAIERATRERPGLRIAYIDIDAHHGDGVEAAFLRRDDVLTVSLHESGRYLFPGTGAARDIGEGAGRGFAVNVALPPGAGPASSSRRSRVSSYLRCAPLALTRSSLNLAPTRIGATRSPI